MRPSFPPRSYSNPYSPRRVAITWRTQYPSCLDWLRPTLLKALQAQREDWWNKTTENLKEIGKTKNHRFLCKEHITFGRVNQCSHNQKSGHIKNLTKYGLMLYENQTSTAKMAFKISGFWIVSLVTRLNYPVFRSWLEYWTFNNRTSPVIGLWLDNWSTQKKLNWSIVIRLVSWLKKCNYSL